MRESKTRTRTVQSPKGKASVSLQRIERAIRAVAFQPVPSPGRHR